MKKKSGDPTILFLHNIIIISIQKKSPNSMNNNASNPTLQKFVYIDSSEEEVDHLIDSPSGKIAR